MTLEIKPCPFRFSGSHGPVEFLHNRNDEIPQLKQMDPSGWNRVFVQCPICKARGPVAWYDDIAVRMWNDVSACIEKVTE